MFSFILPFRSLANDKMSFLIMEGTKNSKDAMRATKTIFNKVDGTHFSFSAICNNDFSHTVILETFLVLIIVPNKEYTWILQTNAHTRNKC